MDSDDEAMNGGGAAGQGAAGASGGVMSQVLFYPLGNLQTRLQAGPGFQTSKIDLNRGNEKDKSCLPGNL